MKPTILLHAPAPADQLAAAQKSFPQYEWKLAPKDAAALERDIASAEIIFGKPSLDLLAKAAKLKWLQTQSAGVENIAGSDVFKRSAWMLCTAAGMHESCVQHAIALLLGFTRRVGQHSLHQKEKRWSSRDVVATPEVVEGRTMLILGLGAIGKRVAQIARVLGMKPIGVNTNGTPVAEVDETHPISNLDALLPRADVLMMILPATPATDKLLNSARLAKLPKHAIVVNVGRGNAIDEPALIAALRENIIAGAALDVFAQEPLPADSPFYDTPNLVMTPHIGGNRPDYDDLAFEIFVENLALYAAGKPLKNVVERERGY
jgi:phosphoglycerate dehydrogenase-like enzyme